MIEGIVSSGSRTASGVSDEIQAERNKAAGVQLIKGTLNVTVENLSDVVANLGKHSTETQLDDKKGSLKWWCVDLRFPRFQNKVHQGFIVRHSHSNTKYLEVMSEISFRGIGVEDNDIIEFELNTEG